jgi:signal peptidase
MNAETQLHALCCELVHDVARRAGEVRLQVTGASMLPAVWPGDVVTVRSCGLAELLPGQIALYRRDGKLTAHRIQHLSNDHLIARGDSLPCPDPPVKPWEIVGRVVSISRAGRLIHPEQAVWQRVASAILRRSELCKRITLHLRGRLRRLKEQQTSWAGSSQLPVRE